MAFCFYLVFVLFFIGEEKNNFILKQKDCSKIKKKKKKKTVLRPSGYRKLQRTCGKGILKRNFTGSQTKIGTDLS